MIGRLRGRLVAKHDNRIVLDVNGVGYEVVLPPAVAKALTAQGIGDELEIVTLCFLQMDQARATPLLIGFEDELQREFFERLLSVPKLGPRAALNLFSAPMSTLAAAIERGDDKFLIGLPGVGKQRARDIIASLQGKMAKFALKQEAIEPAREEEIPPIQTIMEQAMEIMLALGYRAREAEAMLKRALEHHPEPESAEDLVKTVYELQQGK